MNYFILAGSNDCIQHVMLTTGYRVLPFFVSETEAAEFAAGMAAHVARVGDAPFIGETLQNHIELAAATGVTTVLINGGLVYRVANVSDIPAILSDKPPAPRLDMGQSFLN